MCQRVNGSGYHYQHGQKRLPWTDQKKEKEHALQKFGDCQCQPSEVGPGLEQSESRKKAIELKQNNLQETGGTEWWKADLFAQNDQEREKQYIFLGNKDQRFQDWFNSNENLAHWIILQGIYIYQVTLLGILELYYF